MSVTFPNLTMDDFKHGVAEFSKAAPTCDRDSLENGLKAVNLMYLNIAVTPLNLAMAPGYLKFAHKHYMLRDAELMTKE